MATEASRKTSNGCVVARRVPRMGARCRQPSVNIAAIDFGTTNCSLAYIIGGDSDDDPQLLNINGTLRRVPTAILFDEYGIATEFGILARESYRNLGDEERLQCAYFEQIKMELQRDESVNREMKVKAQNGKEYYLVEVIAHILKFLKDEFIQMLTNSKYDLKATDFDWVITVPAIWRARGKQLMREAGYKAGLCSQDSCTNLKPAFHLPVPPDEPHPEKLSLALEPESAAIFCQTMSRKQLAQHCHASEPFTASSYLIIDIGGGTVDISAHRVVEGAQTCIHVLHPPTGNDCGGAKVNREFCNFLQTLIQDEGFQRFLYTGDESRNAKNKAYLSELINKNFEEQKKLFVDKKCTTGHKRPSFAVELPHPFLKAYCSDLQEGITNMDGTEVQLVEQDLRLSYDLMTKFFEPITDRILECVSQTLSDIKQKIKKIYLVGGFGGCKYLSRAIEEKFSDYECIIPLEASYAVVRGAVFCVLHPDMVKCRSVDATYGIAVSLDFDLNLHNPKYRFEDDDGKPRCNSLFLTVVERGDLVGSNVVFTQSIHPLNHKQTYMTLNFYCSLEKDVWYITGQRGKGSHNTEPVEVHKIGDITIEMPDLTGDKSRFVDVTFDFSHTEIKVQAFDQTSGRERKTVLDFLSSLSVHLHSNVDIV